MKTHSFFRLPALLLTCLLVFVATTFADTFSGKVSDLDAGNGLLTVTSKVAESTKVFKVTPETVIVGSDGKPSQLMNLIERTYVSIEAAPGPGNVAIKITVLPDDNMQIP